MKKELDRIYIPKSVVIFGKKFKIKIVDTQDYLGLCDSRTSTIYLSRNQTAKEAYHTLIHEFIHAWQFRVGVNQAISREMLEVISEGLATVMLECFEIKPKY